MGPEFFLDGIEKYEFNNSADTAPISAISILDLI